MHPVVKPRQVTLERMAKCVKGWSAAGFGRERPGSVATLELQYAKLGVEAMADTGLGMDGQEKGKRRKGPAGCNFPRRDMILYNRVSDDRRFLCQWVWIGDE